MIDIGELILIFYIILLENLTIAPNIFIYKNQITDICPGYSITAPEDIETRIKMLGAGLHIDRSAVIRSIIDVGVRQKLTEFSLISSWKRKSPWEKRQRSQGYRFAKCLIS